MSTKTQAAHVEPGYAHLDLRWGSVVAMRVSLRSLLACTTLLVAAVLCAALSLTVGDIAFSPREIIDALLGQGSSTATTVVLKWRTPLAVAAILFGLLLGAAGAVFQSLTRNPLGSPDIIGFDAGSYTAIMVAMLLFGISGYWSIAAFAVGGGLLTAAIVYFLARRRGAQAGFRLIIVGIAVAALLGAIDSFLIERTDQTGAIAVGFWGAGSLSRVDWTNLPPAMLVGSAVLVAILLCSPALRQLELGDDAAQTHGLRLNRQRMTLLALGVIAAAIVTAAAGPIAFVALSAPQIARRLTRSAGVSVASAACMGALLLSVAALISAVLSTWNHNVPVGLITVCGGGLYLIWLLVHERRNIA